jgi:hypothetical protein
MNRWQRFSPIQYTQINVCAEASVEEDVFSSIYVLSTFVKNHITVAV